MLHLGKSLPPQKLVATRWAFATAEGHPLSANVHFAPDGAIAGDSPLGGDRWSIEGEEFRLSSTKGQDSWRADHLYVRDGSLHVSLRGVEDPSREALLYECTPDGHLGFGGQAGLPAGEFLFPRDLQVTPTGLTRVLLVGSCLTELYHRTYVQAIPEVAFDYVLFNSASDLPATPPHPVGSYDFQYLQIPLRTVLTDRIITGGRIFDPAFLDQTYRDGCMMIDAMLEAGLAYNRAHGLLTFVSTFIVPQLDIVAGLDRRLADGDIAFLIRRLN
ncbi:phosphatase, partial [Methylobacterium frigidaeris]